MTSVRLAQKTGKSQGDDMWYWLLVWACLVYAEQYLQCDTQVLLVVDGQWKEVWIGQKQLTENKVPFHKEWSDPYEWSVNGGHVALKSMGKFSFSDVLQLPTGTRLEEVLWPHYQLGVG